MIHFEAEELSTVKEDDTIRGEKSIALKVVADAAAMNVECLGQLRKDTTVTPDL
jgi:hypothetical protein